MDNYINFEYEDEESKKVILDVVDSICCFDIGDIIARIAGLNILSENQNKTVLSDTLLQYIFERKEEEFGSSARISDKKFKKMIDDINGTFLSAAIDPCENSYIQNVMFDGKNFRVFNGVDISPAYNLQAMIYILFGYENNYSNDYLCRVNRLFSLVLALSEKIVINCGITLENAIYNEERKIMVPSSEIVREYASYVCVSLDSVNSFVEGYFDLNEICIDFGEKNHGNLNNKAFYTKPFWIDKRNNKIIILNVTLLPAFALYKAIEWAGEYGIKDTIIDDYNNYIWFECDKILESMGHNMVITEAYGVECVDKKYYKEAIYSVYNNQILYVCFLCDDARNYSSINFHDRYPVNCHQILLQKRLLYFGENICRLGVEKEDVYFLVIINSIGRELAVAIKSNPFGFKPVSFNPFELRCVSIHEKNNQSFLPRYIRAKNKLKTFGGGIFSELNAISIYTSNHNTFYISDDFDPETTEMIIAPGDSVSYISDSLLQENRMLIRDYNDNVMEVILVDKKRNIFAEKRMIPEKYIAFCVAFKNVIIWIKTDEVSDVGQLNIYYSLVDTISYWLSECKLIIEAFKFQLDVLTIHISLGRDYIEYYYEQEKTPLEDSIVCNIESSHIYLMIFPGLYGNLNHSYNESEKELTNYILNIILQFSNTTLDYSLSLEDIFSNKLKKKFFFVEDHNKPYLKPITNMARREVHSEDEDYLAGIIGKELLETGEWEIGIVDDSKRSKIANIVVGWLYNRLKEKVAEFNPDHIIEMIYQDLEETIFSILLAERRYYSDIACYPEKEDEYLEIYNNLNKTSLALKFLIEYVTAIPPVGNKILGIGQYEELLAICSMIIEWAYKGDLFFYNIFNTPVEFLKSKRIGMKRDEFIDMYQYNDKYRRRQLKYNASYSLRKEYQVVTRDFSEELTNAFKSEFGYTYDDFVKVIVNMDLLDDTDVICIKKGELVSRLLEIDDSLNETLINNVLNDITYQPRKDFLIMPKGFAKEDAYPWRFNRKYSFIRRPVVARGDELIWGHRQLFLMIEYVNDLIFSGRFKAESDEMKTLCGCIAKHNGAVFNELIVRMIDDMDYYEVHPNVKKINGKRIAQNGGDLGDIDILMIDRISNKVIVAEVKNFRFSRNPREINLEYTKMFVDENGKSCFTTKHKKRTEWVKNHIEDLKEEFNLDNGEWVIKGVFILNQPLISQHIYKQGIQCISKAELCLEVLKSI